MTLIAGIYGMNGLDLSEIEAMPAGFIVVIVTMMCVGGGLLGLFIEKQWLLVRERDKQNGMHSEDNELHRKSNTKGRADYHIFKREKDG